MVFVNAWQPKAADGLSTGVVQRAVNVSHYNSRCQAVALFPAEVIKPISGIQEPLPMVVSPTGLQRPINFFDAQNLLLWHNSGKKFKIGIS